MSTRLAAPLRTAGLGALLLVLGAACASEQASSRTVELETLSDSGVSGTAVLTDLGAGRTRVVVEVDPADYPRMPAHIHPGTCINLVPQPTYPLEDVVDGSSETEIEASLEDLFAGEFALNLHASSNDWETYTACAELTE
ncbi:MAG TPA: hypothetical protein VFP83_07990 [Candidatus Limnocylindria bacterium]|nr:hypothetical protein [Candidatus Limnocylindria bacterium]